MGFCPNCGSEIESHLKFCSKCGTKLEDDQPASQPAYAQPPPQPAYAQPTSQPMYAPPPPAYQPYGTRPYGVKGSKSMGIGALICGINSLCFGIIPVVGLILGIIAIILGAVGTRRDESPGMATAGVVLGAIGLIIGIFTLIMFISFMSMMFSSPFSYSYYY